MTKRNINISILLLTLLIAIAIGVVIIGIARSSGLLASADLGAGGSLAPSSVAGAVYLKELRRADLAPGSLSAHTLGLNAEAGELLNTLHGRLPS